MKWRRSGWGDSLGKGKLNSVRDNGNNLPQSTKEN